MQHNGICVSEAIEQRRSVRQFQNRPVPNELLVSLCKAGLCAPSARNGQPWEMIVVRQRELLKQLSAIRKPWHALVTAGAAIVICGREEKYLQQDCAAAAENILLLAQAMGLGACWLGLYPNRDAQEAVQTLLQLPEDIMAVMIIAIGYPDDPVQRAPREMNAAKIHFERFGGKAS